MKKEMIVFRNANSGDIAVFSNERDFLEFFAIYIAEFLKNPHHLNLTPTYGADYQIWHAPLNPEDTNVFNDDK